MVLKDQFKECALNCTSTVEDVMFCIGKLASSMEKRFRASYNYSRSDRTVGGHKQEYICIFEKPPAGDEVLLLEFNKTMFLDPSTMNAYALAFINDVVDTNKRELVCDLIKYHIRYVIDSESLFNFTLQKMTVSGKNAK